MLQTSTFSITITNNHHISLPFHPPIPPSSGRDISHITDASIMPSTTAEALAFVSRTVSVAPLVLLSATDHFSRSAKGTRKRVLGVLLGQNDGKNVRVSNSFAGQYSLP